MEKSQYFKINRTKIRIMYQLDKIDKKILSQLDKNSRVPLKSLAKNARHPYHVVSYRFDQLVKRGIIKKCVTEVGLGKLGFFVYKIFFQLKGLTEERQEDFFSFLVDHKDIIWVAACEGRWDLMIAVYSRDVIEFSEVKDEIFRKFGDNISEYDITTIKDVHILKRSYLMNPKEPRTFPKNYKQEFYIAGNKRAGIDEKDGAILKLIAGNSRLGLMKIAKKTGLNPKTVASRIAELEKNGVIQGYCILIDLNKIGYKFYKMVVYLQDVREENYKKLIEFFKAQPNVIHLIEAIGPWEIELEIETTSDRDFHALSKSIRNCFPGVVKKIETAFISDEMKLVYLPAKL